MTVGGVFICTLVGYLFGVRRGRKERKPKMRLCQHGVATDAMRCLRCAAEKAQRR